MIGLEVFAEVALLRSLAVLPENRNSSYGKALVVYAEQHAESLGIKTLYLLTTTVDGYFSRLGYLPMSRTDAPSSIKSTAHYSGLCPMSSIFMAKKLPG